MASESKNGRKTSRSSGAFGLSLLMGCAMIWWQFGSTLERETAFAPSPLNPRLRSSNVLMSADFVDMNDVKQAKDSETIYGEGGSYAQSATTPSFGFAALAGCTVLFAGSALARRSHSKLSSQGQRRGHSSQSLRMCAVKTVERKQLSAVDEVKTAEHSNLSTAEALRLAPDVLLNNYGQRELAFSRGEGHYLFDDEGRKFLDFTSGIAVNCLGHSDAGWAEVVAKQAQTLTHTSNMFLTPPQVELAEKLTRLSFADKAYFCNSGTEANEAAIKFARKFHYAQGKPRERFVAFENSFHGRTMGSLALTWKDKIKTPFQPIMPSANFLPYNNVAALEAIDETTCAVFCEPLQGEGGILPGCPAFLTALRKRCDEVGALLVFDEVQCGLGRTGTLFAYENTGVKPDILTLAKPLAGGIPVGAVLTSDKVASSIAPGDHGSTFAGAPLVAAAACYTLDRVSNQSFLDNVCAMGGRLRRGLAAILEPYSILVRGQGLLTGVVFDDVETCAKIRKLAQDDGLLVLTAGAGNVMRIAPALTATEAEIDEALRILEKAMNTVLSEMVIS